MRRVGLWLFASPRRLWGTTSAALVVALVVSAGYVGVRVASFVDAMQAPRPAAEAPALTTEEQLALRSPDVEALPTQTSALGDPAPVALQVANAWLAGDLEVLSQVAEPGLLEADPPTGVQVDGEPEVTLVTADTARVAIPTTAGPLTVALISTGEAWRAYGLEGI